MRSEHKVLGGERTVLDDPRALCDRRNQNQHRCVIKDVKLRITEKRSEVVGMERCRYSRHIGEGVRLRFTRDPVDQNLIPDYRERPWLLVHGVWCVHCSIDQAADHSWINGLICVLGDRTSTRDRFVNVHRQFCHKRNLLGPPRDAP